MHKIRAYADTSVFGGILDKDFDENSLKFFKKVEDGEFLLLLSSETLRELSEAPEEVKAVLLNLSEGTAEEVPIDDEVKDQADEYIAAKVLGPASISDALHVAAATVAGADLIVSWNFKHIVSFNRIRGYNSVNIRFGYRTMTILSPKEVSDENEMV
jgi:predicted nucleic acid-binding protein